MDITEGYNLQSLSDCVLNQPSGKLMTGSELRKSESSVKKWGEALELNDLEGARSKEVAPQMYPELMEELFKVPTRSNPFPAPRTKAKPMESYTSDVGSQCKLVVVMVGLPARGKTYIARKLLTYLSWIGLKVSMFNIGRYRRSMYSNQTVGTTSKAFFDPKDEKAVERRREIALLAIKDLIEYLKGEGQVGILDGTNSTTARRNLIRNYIAEVRKTSGVRFRILFVESICSDEELIERNIMSTKLCNPDYVSVDPKEAIKDFRERILEYESIYVPLTTRDGSFIKLINSGERLVGHAVFGYVEGRIMYFLMHLNLNRKPIFLTRHGESEYNVQGRVGGDAPLSAAGRQYAKALVNWFDLQPECTKVTISIRGLANITGTYTMQCDLISARPCYKSVFKDLLLWYHERLDRWVITKLQHVKLAWPKNAVHEGYVLAVLDEENVSSPEKGAEFRWKVWDAEACKLKSSSPVEILKDAGCRLWCSTLQRTIQTVSVFTKMKPVRWRALSEIEVGTCDGLTYEEIKHNFPDEYRKRQEDKLCYRYPGGESYKDVIQRLEPVIFELERSRLPVIVVGHRAVLRCLYGYFVGAPEDEIPHMELPLHEVIKLSPGAYGTEVTRYPFGVKAETGRESHPPIELSKVNSYTKQLLTY